MSFPLTARAEPVAPAPEGQETSVGYVVQRDVSYPRGDEGTADGEAVVVELSFNSDGAIMLRPVTGHSLLIPATMDAVSQLVYGVTYLNGQAVGIVTTVTVNFSLREGSGGPDGL